MTLVAASILALSLVPAAALKVPAIPAPAPASATESSGPVAEKLPAVQRPRYELFAQKCSRCHALERALAAAFSPDQWDDYLRKKYRRAGTGISPQQAEEIAKFLRYWSTARR
jgi:mono/diheme cytochrome c family protein